MGRPLCPAEVTEVGRFGRRCFPGSNMTLRCSHSRKSRCSARRCGRIRRCLQRGSRVVTTYSCCSGEEADRKDR